MNCLYVCVGVCSGGTRGGGGHWGGANAPPVRGFAPPLAPPSQNGIFFFFFFYFFFFFFLLFLFFFVLLMSYKVTPVTNLKLISAFSAISAFQKVTNMTFKYSNFRALKSVNPKSSGGSAPWTPGRGSAPAPRQGP